jgi:hypothetical protein
VKLRKKKKHTFEKSLDTDAVAVEGAACGAGGGERGRNCVRGGGGGLGAERALALVRAFCSDSNQKNKKKTARETEERVDERKEGGRITKRNTV